MPNPDLHERIVNDFEYHPPRAVPQVVTFTRIRDRFADLAHWLVEAVPPVGAARELAMSLSSLEQASQAAISACARHWADMGHEFESDGEGVCHVCGAGPEAAAHALVEPGENMQEAAARFVNAWGV